MADLMYRSFYADVGAYISKLWANSFRSDFAWLARTCARPGLGLAWFSRGPKWCTFLCLERWTRNIVENRFSRSFLPKTKEEEPLCFLFFFNKRRRKARRETANEALLWVFFNAIEKASGEGDGELATGKQPSLSLSRFFGAWQGFYRDGLSGLERGCGDGV